MINKLNRFQNLRNFKENKLKRTFSKHVIRNNNDLQFNLAHKLNSMSFTITNKMSTLA